MFNFGGEFKDVTKFNKDEMFQFRRKVQMVFQDPTPHKPSEEDLFLL